MFLCNKTRLLFLILFTSISLSSSQANSKNSTFSVSFPLVSRRFSPRSLSPSYYSSFVSQTSQNDKPKAIAVARARAGVANAPALSYRSKFKYSMALIVSLPIGTPPQTQDMVLDTGSQLSWIKCRKKAPAPPTTSFDPSRSSSFSVLPCTHPLCKPRIVDFTLPTDCDHNRLCHYSYFYADGTFAEGNLVKEKFTFSASQSTLPLILGCAKDTREDKGILGMNLGRLSFASQAKISKFSYCVPPRRSQFGYTPTGSFYLGENPNSAGFRYVNFLTFPQSQRSPNLDPLAYSVPMQGIRVKGKKLDIPATAFHPDASGSGQTMVDSGSEFTYLVDVAYNKVKEEIVSLVGPNMKKGYVYGGVADMCFDARNAIEIGQLIGDMVFEFEKGAEILIEKDRVLADVGGGVHCVGIGRSDMLGLASNIIGNFHQQNLWVEFDIGSRRVGFGKADCSRSV